MMGFLAADIIYQIFILILYVPKNVHTDLPLTTNNNLANASFPNCINLKPTASLALH
jgi:hypothetical protein